MARFRFSLQQVLDQRFREERRKQRAVAALERERLELEEEIRSRQRQIVACKSDLRGMLGGAGPGRIDLRGVRHQMNASLGMATSTQPLAIRLAGVHQRLRSARQELMEAATARKAVEQLKNRRYEQWLAEERRREDTLLDEVSTARFARRTIDEEHRP